MPEHTPHSGHQHNESCKEIFALLSQYLDMELPEESCEEVAAHLQDCPPCIEFAESLRKTVELCRGYRPTELPAQIGAEAEDQLRAAYQRMLAARR